MRTVAFLSSQTTPVSIKPAAYPVSPVSFGRFTEISSSPSVDVFVLSPKKAESVLGQYYRTLAGDN